MGVDAGGRAGVEAMLGLPACSRYRNAGWGPHRVWGCPMVLGWGVVMGQPCYDDDNGIIVVISGGQCPLWFGLVKGPVRLGAGGTWGVGVDPGAVDHRRFCG
jgi:hypothetical protein